MKFLWIEDFGGKQSSEEELSKAIFKTILSKNDDELTKIYAAYDSDSEFDNELPKLFQKNTIHEIVICRTFKDWNDNIKNIFDFDVVLIDINLAKGSSPDDIPDGYGNEFHNKAGFYIYQEIIKLGLPDDNIAFFTGETGSFQGFKKSCISNSIPFPKNVFEKKNDDYERIGNWLKQKAETDYLILRRAIIDGCSELLNEIDNDNKFIFNKTIYRDKKSEPINPLTSNDVERYLEKLKYFFSLNSPSEDNRKQKYYSFVKELSDLWERSQGFIRRSDVNYTSIEYNFKNFCQNQMKLLRNWTAHNQLSNDLTEKEVGFYFIIAMRALFNLKVDRIYHYEKLIFSMFKKMELKKEDILKNLANSYYNLRNIYSRNQNPTRSEFKSLLEEVWKQRKYQKKDSIRFFYQNFIQSLNPAILRLHDVNRAEKFKNLHDKVFMFVEFDFYDLEKFSFLNEFAKSIFKLAF